MRGFYVLYVSGPAKNGHCHVEMGCEHRFMVSFRPEGPEKAAILEGRGGNRDERGQILSSGTSHSTGTAAPAQIGAFLESPFCI